ncbi:MAG: hypothetical protein BroJett009_01880 [Armatimonadota bacterium]|nr:MAG: hypothetical protein BroJett009_01880 [Armatimonadota bacterium]
MRGKNFPAHRASRQTNQACTIQTMPRDRHPTSRDLARASRKGPSVAEDIMWEFLRASRTGFKFRREHPVGGFRIDFFCREAMLGVEMDGEQHDANRDATRDKELSNLGILIHRIPNRRFLLLDPTPYQDDVATVVNLCEQRSGRKAFPDVMT